MARARARLHGEFMVILDATIVNVALPSIQADLEMSDADLQWIVNAYALMFGGFLLLGGRAGDLIGRKRIFLVGVVIFTVASLVKRARPISESSSSSAGCRDSAPRSSPRRPSRSSLRRSPRAPSARRRWACGRRSRSAAERSDSCSAAYSTRRSPGRGSSSSTSRSASRCSSPPCAIVPESKDEHEHKSFDIAGAVTVTAGLLVLVYEIVKAQEKGWTSLHTGGFFAARDRPAGRVRGHRAPVRRAARRLRSSACAPFAPRTSSCSSSPRDCSRCSTSTPSTSSACSDTRALEAGLAFLPFTAGIIIGAGLSQELVPKLGAREVPLIGMTMAVVGLLLFVRLEPDGTSRSTSCRGSCSRLSAWASRSSRHAHRYERHPDDDAGLASGLYNTSQQVGGALGLAILATLAVERHRGHAERARTQAAAGRRGAGARRRLPRRVPRQRDAHRRRGLRAPLLLRRSDVVAVGEGEPAMSPAA